MQQLQKQRSFFKSFLCHFKRLFQKICKLSGDCSVVAYRQPLQYLVILNRDYNALPLFGVHNYFLSSQKIWDLSTFVKLPQLGPSDISLGEGTSSFTADSMIWQRFSASFLLATEKVSSSCICTRGILPVSL